MYMKLLPPDPMPEDFMLLNAIAIALYQKLEDPTDKFIIAMVYDMGYTREDTARALGVSYVTVYKRIKVIKEVLKKEYKRNIKD